jgi:hypothetical protein
MKKEPAEYGMKVTTDLSQRSAQFAKSQDIVVMK